MPIHTAGGKEGLSPQGLLLPISRETHCIGVDHRISRQQLDEFVFKPVSRINDVHKMLQDAKRKEYSTLFHLVGNPRCRGASHRQRTQREEAIPKAAVMAAGVSGQRDDRHPRGKDRNGQAEMLRDSLANLIISDILVNPCQNSQGNNLRQHPRRGPVVGIGIPEVKDEILTTAAQLFVDQMPCLVKLIPVGKIGGRRHPEHIVGLSARDVHNGTSDRHLDPLKLIEHQETQLPVELIQR